MHTGATRKKKYDEAKRLLLWVKENVLLHRCMQFLQYLNALKVFLNVWIVTGIFFTACTDFVNLTCYVGKQPEYDACFWFKTNQINSERPCRSPPKPLTCEHENCPLDDNPTYFRGCLLTHLAECRGAALGDLRLQHANQFTELHAIIELLHEKLRSHLLACKAERLQMKSTVKCKWPCFFAWAALKKRLLR